MLEAHMLWDELLTKV